MNDLMKQPAVMLVAGLLLGGGMVQTAWMLSGHSKEAPVTQTPVAGVVTRSEKRGTSAGPLSRGLVKAVPRDFSKMDPRMAWEQASGISNFTERLDFLSALMREWGRQDPQAAIEKARGLPVGMLQKEALGAACAGWASRHPEQAADWAKTNLNGPLAGEVFAVIAGEWATSAPESAAAGLPACLMEFCRRRRPLR